jgi:hypothetical protein
MTEELDLEFGRIKLEIETALAKSGFNCTVLGEAPSMEVFFAMITGYVLCLLPQKGTPFRLDVPARTRSAQDSAQDKVLLKAGAAQRKHGVSDDD